MGVLNRAPAPIDTDRPAAADFVRVLATWAVGAFHIWQQSWYGGAAPAHWLRAGSVGVDLLVMLSAFCLFLPWANAAVRDQPLPRIRPAEFYRRRALRLLPAYYASLLFGLVLAVARRGWSKALALDLAAHLALTQQLYRPAYLACQLNGVTWTLTVFALFYLVFPLLAPLCAKWPLPTLAALGLVQLGYTCWLLPQYGSGDYSARFNQLPAFSGVLARGTGGGMGVCQIRPRRLGTARSAPRGLYGAGVGGAHLAGCRNARPGCGGRVPAVPTDKPDAAGPCGCGGAGVLWPGPDAAPGGCAAPCVGWLR